MSSNNSTVDLQIINQGSLVGFRYMSTDAHAFLTGDEVVSEGWQWMGNTLYVDHRLAPVLMDGCIEHGLTYVTI